MSEPYEQYVTLDASVLYYDSTALRATCTMTPNSGYQVNGLYITVYDALTEEIILDSRGDAQGATSQAIQVVAGTDLYPRSYGFGRNVVMRITGWVDQQSSFTTSRSFTLQHPPPPSTAG